MKIKFDKLILCSIVAFLFFQIGFSQSQPQVNQRRIIRKSFSQQWELDSIYRKGTFRLVSYKPIYITAGRWTSKTNKFPVSENPDYASDEQQDYNNFEAKFQLSFKSKVMQSIFWGCGDLWIAYTQKAHWQVYNKKLSRSFRELNYEPEIILNFPLNKPLFGGKLRTTSIAINHQSNGKDLPLSRSWNRIIFNVGYEIGNWDVIFKPWIRLSDEEDENPLITKYIGNGELDLSYTYYNHEFNAIITHPFNSLKYGGMQLNYVFPIEGHLRGHVQAFHGYGETLVDYNHSQTSLGIGISFANW